MPASGGQAKDVTRLSSALAGLAGLSAPAPRRPAVPPPGRPIFSEEQEAFLASSHPRLLLSALAGCGKTTVLFEYARRRPHQKWRLLVLNRALAEQLAKIAPANVEVSTLHKLAYASQGHLLSAKLIPGAIPLAALGKLFPAAPPGFLPSLRDGLDLFCLSSDPSPAIHHAPLAWQSDPEWDPDSWLASLNLLWSSCLDPSSAMPTTHAVYLKRFCQQEHPWTGTHWMLDEAQDWPNAVLSAFARCARISVRAGDPCQRLYAFRGASLGVWHDPSREQEFSLSRSFRSSQALAPWLNACLSRLPGGWVWEGRDDIACTITPRQTSSSIDELMRFSPDAVLADRWSTLDGVANALSGRRGVCWPSGSSRTSPPGPSPDLLCSTIHSAKGREFDRVWLPDDFLSVGLPPAQSARLGYVALSRARHALSFSATALPSAMADLDEAPLFEDEPGFSWID